MEQLGASMSSEVVYIFGSTIGGDLEEQEGRIVGLITIVGHCGGDGGFFCICGRSENEHT
jgi:hypothetical protein